MWNILFFLIFNMRVVSWLSCLDVRVISWLRVFSWALLNLSLNSLNGFIIWWKMIIDFVLLFDGMNILQKNVTINSVNRAVHKNFIFMSILRNQLTFINQTILFPFLFIYASYSIQTYIDLTSNTFATFQWSPGFLSWYCRGQVNFASINNDLFSLVYLSTLR